MIHIKKKKNPPSSAGDTGSIPGWGTKIPHALRQLSTSTTEPIRPKEEPVCHN